MAEVNLTEQQKAVVENQGGSLLVSAAAGSGKTKVLVERLFRYITEEHRNVDDFLIITYTRAAASELRSKIASELSRRIALEPGNLHIKRQLLRVYRAEIKTVNAFCTGLLRENVHLLAQEKDQFVLTPDFRVLDEKEAEVLQQQVLRRTLSDFYEHLDAGKSLLADTLGAGQDDRNLESLVLELYRKIQSHASPENWLAQNRTLWQKQDIQFSHTPYASVLLDAIRRSARHWAKSLSDCAGHIDEPDIAAAYSEKFMTAANAFREVSGADNWETAQKLSTSIIFPRLTTPRGRKDDAAPYKRVWVTKLF